MRSQSQPRITGQDMYRHKSSSSMGGSQGMSHGSSGGASSYRPQTSMGSSAVGYSSQGSSYSPQGSSFGGGASYSPQGSQGSFGASQGFGASSSMNYRPQGFGAGAYSQSSPQAYGQSYRAPQASQMSYGQGMAHMNQYQAGYNPHAGRGPQAQGGLYQDPYSTQTQRPRKPSGANTIQPPQNSGQPGAQNLKPMQQTSQPLKGMDSQQTGQARLQNNVSGTGSYNPMAWDGGIDPYGRPPYGSQPQQPRQGQQSQLTQQQPQVQQGSQIQGQQKNQGANALDPYGSQQPQGQQQKPIAQQPIQGQQQKPMQGPQTQQPIQDQDPTVRALADADRYYSETRQLSQPGVSDFTDYNNKTQIKNQRTQENNDRLESQLQHQQDGAGLQASNRELANFGGPVEQELARRDARSLNHMHQQEQARAAAYNEGQDNIMNQHSANLEAQRSDAKEKGIEDWDQTKNDLSKLTAEYGVYNKANPGTSFKSYLQEKVNHNEIDRDTLKALEENYGTFTPKPSVEPGTDAGHDRYYQGQQNVADMRAANKEARDQGYSPDLNQKQREGFDRRVEQAARSSDISAEIGAARARGIDPYAANANAYATANKNAMLDAQTEATDKYYGQVEKLQSSVLDTQKQISADAVEKTREQNAARAQEQQALEQQREENRQKQREFEERENERDREAKARLQGGRDPKEKVQETAAEQKQQNQQSSAAMQGLLADSNFRREAPESFAMAANHFNASGVPIKDQGKLFGELYQADFTNQDVASGTIGNIAQHSRKSAAQRGDWTTSYFDRQKFQDEAIMQNAGAIKVIGYAAGLSPDQIAQQVYPPQTNMGTHDPFLNERRQRLMDALVVEEQQ